MKESTEYVMVDHRRLTFVERLISLAAWGIAGAIFLTVGWIVLRPEDPQAAVSLLLRRGAVGAWWQTAGLAVVASGIATVIAGRLLPHVGVFAVCLGMSAVSVQGNTTAYFLLSGLGSDAVGQRGLGVRFAMEAAAWSLIVVVAWLSAALLTRWLRIPAPAQPGTDRRSSLGWSVVGQHVGLATIVALAVFSAFSSGLHGRAIHHGQSCFLVVISVMIAGYAAYRWAPVASAVWLVVATVMAALVGYVFSSMQKVTALPPGVPTSHFLRVLPMQFVFVGTAAAIVSYWWSEDHRHAIGGAGLRPEADAT